MAANNLGTAYIKIAPQMEGIQSSIANAIQGATKSGSSVSTASIAIGNVISKGISTAVGAITNSIDGAIRRTDIINNFSKVMSNMGISADDSQKSIDKLVEKLDGLPTALQDGASAVQRFTSKNGDIQKSTDIFLALNNAILAGAAPTELQATAIEQISQAYAKGKPDMMEWRSMMSAMPAQLNQIAKKMGFGANAANKLGEALRKGDVSMDDFMNTIIELNQNGSDEFKSFEEQARNSTDGIGTAMTNVRNRIAAALQKIINAFGSKNIADAINKLSSSFSGIADWIGKNIVPIIKERLIPVLKNVLTAIKNVIEFIAQNKWVQSFLVGVLNTIIAYKAVTTVTSLVKTFATTIVGVATNLGSAVTAFKSARAAGLTFSTAMGAASASSTGLTSSVTGGASAIGNLWHSFVGLTGSATAAIGALGAVGIAIAAIPLAVTAVQTATIEATTAARDYERQIRSVNFEIEQNNRLLSLQESILQDVKDALDAQSSAELAYLEAKKRASELEENYNKLLGDSSVSADDLRIAELELSGAISDRDKKQRALNEAIESTKEAESSYYGSQTAAINKLNENAIATDVLAGNYATAAQKIDDLAKSTITYKDINGNLVQSTQEQSAQTAYAAAEMARHIDETWKEIVDIAQTEGISYREACARVGQESGGTLNGEFSTAIENTRQLAVDATAITLDQINEKLDAGSKKTLETGEDLMNNFKESIGFNAPKAENKSREVMNNILDKMNAEAGRSYDIGVQLVGGANTGLVNNQGTLWSSAASMIRTAIQRMKDAGQIQSPSKKTAEIGKFLSLGLAKGIDDYADEAVEAAKEATEATLEAFNGDTALGASATQLQPYNGLTSGLNGSGGNVTQYNTFNQVDTNLDMQEISKRLGWQVATAI